MERRIDDVAVWNIPNNEQATQELIRTINQLIPNEQFIVETCPSRLGGMVTAFVKCRKDSLHPYLVECLDGWISSNGKYKAHINTPDKIRRSKSMNTEIHLM